MDEVGGLQNELRELMSRKDEIEKEIKVHLDLLESQRGVGMTGPLVDADQFPRSDIDLCAVRQSRHKVICLQNDHKELMKLIESKLHELHAAASQRPDSSSPMEIDGQDGADREHLTFARIDLVDDNSPASAAGLQVGDEIVQFGSVSNANFTGMQSIASIVQHSQGKSLPVLVRRNGLSVRLSVTPNTWSGRGLLGCHIVPIKK
jgi:26S proteasome non-ATPase regulatory subunit 9